MSSQIKNRRCSSEPSPEQSENLTPPVIWFRSANHNRTSNATDRLNCQRSNRGPKKFFTCRAFLLRTRLGQAHAIGNIVAEHDQQRTEQHAEARPSSRRSWPPAPPLAAAAPIVAALAEVASAAGSAASTPNVKTFPGFVRSSAPSTNARTCSCNNFRPRESRCFTASSVNSKFCATVSMD